MLIPIRLTCLSLLVAWCVLLGTATADAQEQDVPKQEKKEKRDSRQIEQLRTIERHFGTSATGVFMILAGLAGVGWTLWNIRPTFRSDSTWSKIAAVLVICAGIGMGCLGLDLAQAGAQGKSLTQWLKEK